MRWPIALTALYALFVAVGLVVWRESPVITEQEQPMVAWQAVTISGHRAVPDTEGGLSSVDASRAEQAPPLPICPPGFGCAQPLGPVTQLPDLSVVPDFSQLREPTPVVVANSASVRLTPVEGSLTRDAMVGLLSDAGWPEEAIPAALSVAWCESRWRPGAIGDGGRAIGLFQLQGPGVGWGGGDGWFSHFGVTVEQGRDALVNAQVARQVWERSGFSPWSCRPTP